MSVTTVKIHSYAMKSGGVNYTFLNNDGLGGMKATATLAEKYAIPCEKLVVNKTACLVADSDGAGNANLYRLTSLPTGYKPEDPTTADNWTIMTLGSTFTGGITYKGNFDPNGYDGTVATIKDDQTGVASGWFYIVKNATDVTITDAAIFNGEATVLNTGDWIIHDGTRYFVIEQASPDLTWDAITGKPTTFTPSAHDQAASTITLTDPTTGQASTLANLLSIIVYTNKVIATVTDATTQQDKILTLAGLDERYKKNSTFDGDVNGLIETYITGLDLPNTYGSKSTQDSHTSSLASHDNRLKELEDSSALASAGIIGEVADIAARNALTGGDVLNGGTLVDGSRVIATDSDNIRKVYQFTGTTGDSGAAFWNYVYDFDTLVNRIVLQGVAGGAISVGTPMTFKTGKYNKYAVGDSVVGLASQATAVDGDPIKVIQSGIITGLSSLVQNTVYHIQDNGTIGTTNTGKPILIAISTTDGIVLSSGGGSGVKANLTATTDPAVTDDSSKGYAVNSPWLNTTTNEAFKLVDATVGAAVWVKTTLTADELGALAFKSAIDASEITTGTKTNSFISDFAATVRATLLDGLSIATNAAAVATDSVLVALGKLQAQLNYVKKETITSVSHGTTGARAIDYTASTTGQVKVTLTADITSLTFTGLITHRTVLLRFINTGGNTVTLADEPMGTGTSYKGEQLPDFSTVAGSETLWLVTKISDTELVIEGKIL